VRPRQVRPVPGAASACVLGAAPPGEERASCRSAAHALAALRTSFSGRHVLLLRRARPSLADTSFSGRVPGPGARGCEIVRRRGRSGTSCRTLSR